MKTVKTSPVKPNQGSRSSSYEPPEINKPRRTNKDRPWQTRKDPNRLIPRIMGKKGNLRDLPKTTATEKKIRVDDMLISTIDEPPKPMIEFANFEENFADDVFQSKVPLSKEVDDKKSDFSEKRSISPGKRLRKLFQRKSRSKSTSKTYDLSPLEMKSPNKEGILRVSSKEESNRKVLQKRKSVTWKKGTDLEDVTVFDDFDGLVNILENGYI